MKSYIVMVDVIEYYQVEAKNHDEALEKVWEHEPYKAEITDVHFEEL